MAAKGLAIPADGCVVFEDVPAGIEDGCSAGIQTVAIAHMHDPRALEKATMIADQLGDLYI